MSSFYAKNSLSRGTMRNSMQLCSCSFHLATSRGSSNINNPVQLIKHNQVQKNRCFVHFKNFQMQSSHLFLLLLLQAQWEFKLNSIIKACKVTQCLMLRKGHCAIIWVCFEGWVGAFLGLDGNLEHF